MRNKEYYIAVEVTEITDEDVAEISARRTILAIAKNWDEAMFKAGLRIREEFDPSQYFYSVERIKSFP